MADKIVNADDYDWSPSGTKGVTKYRHLLDGNARILNLSDYPQFASLENMRLTLNAAARVNGLRARSKSLNSEQLLFQIIGKKES
jgi:hypothetical protein